VSPDPLLPAAAVDHEWVMRANCSLSPGQLLAMLGALALTSLTIAMVFWWLGVPWVLPFAGLEVLGLVLALLVYAPRANDRETVRLRQGQLEVECRRAGRVTATQWPAARVQARCSEATGGWIELTGAGQRLRLGRHLPPARRPEVARAMQQALRRLIDLGMETK